MNMSKLMKLIMRLYLLTYFYDVYLNKIEIKLIAPRIEEIPAT